MPVLSRLGLPNGVILTVYGKSFKDEYKLMVDPWFPDYIARWYDEFCADFPHRELDRWEGGGGPIMHTWKPRLKKEPHLTAVKMDEFIHLDRYLTKEERRFHALRVASTVFQEMGFRITRITGGGAWQSIRSHWEANGNLLRSVEGYLLPREPRPFQWSWPFEPPLHTIEHYFENFVRWQPVDNPKLNVRVTVLPFTAVPSLAGPLRIAIVPLVSSMGDFHVETDDTDPTYPRFRVKLASPDSIRVAAIKALESSADQGCDIVIFPELCLTPEIQSALQEGLRRRNKDHPWLVVAGSAHTPCGGAPAAYHNQAIVFDSKGKRLLTHHKLHRYLLDVDQQERYGIHEVLGGVNRFEDMDFEPYEIEILDTPAGRLAVLICEDFSAVGFVETLIVKLGLDWLLVPVLDGYQAPHRWPARFARKYAERGVAVAVATSLSFAKQHLLGEAPSVSLPPSPGVGLVLVPSSRGGLVEILKASEHDQPVIHELR